MAIELNSLIRIYDNALPEAVCRFLIDFYETRTEKHERIDNAKRPTFTQLNLTAIHAETAQSKEAHDVVVSSALHCRKLYYDFVDARCFPDEHNFEQFRIKKYKNDGSELFDTHVDVRNAETSNRFLSYIFYLNDVEKGGETVFFTGTTVRPMTGRVVLFPPLWMFPHKGLAPSSNEKYILSTYLLYK